MAEFTVEIDQDLEDIVPGFLENRKKDIELLKQFSNEKNLSEIEKIGHKVSGSSGGYGFHDLGQIAKEIEKLAMANTETGINELIEKFEDYVNNVKINYVDMD
ncbi:Hpt domain-containing protein [Halobacteriovorax sp. HLS]|uniref:Hpt domain-containing protein n=1 Tax=Halobacteriovorax sp. HLS TaxID=2234000 RepID=UPI000FDB2A8F|nr:Hpt domain-containing protein [Halobacteriovorax sp. HLS]